MGGAKRMRNGLTQKQNKFKDIVLQQIRDGKQINATEAAAQTYDVKSRDVANAIGAENLANPSIKLTIEQELDKIGATSSQILWNLNKMANATPEKYDASTILKANIEIMKLRGMVKTDQTQNFSLTFNQQVNNLTFKEIEEELAMMRATNEELVTEAKPLQDTP